MHRCAMRRGIGSNLLGIIVKAGIAVLLVTAMPRLASAQAEEKLLDESRRVARTASVGELVKTFEVQGSFTEPPRGSLGTLTSGGKTTALPEEDSYGKVRFLFEIPGRYRQDYTYLAKEGFTLWVSTTARSKQEIWKKLDFPDTNLPPGASVSHPPSGPVPLDEVKRKQIRGAEARLRLAFLLNVDPSFPVKFTYAGVAEAPDGEADVLDGAGPDEFNVRLFLDRKTHLPLMLSFQEPASAHTTQVRLGDYREAKGMMLPHLLSFSEDAQLTREIRIEKYEINGKVSPGSFEKDAK